MFVNLLKKIGMIRIAVLVSLLFMSFSLCAQTTTPAQQPTGSMFLGIGIAYNHYTDAPGYATNLDFGAQIGSSHFYSISTLTLQSKVATMRTGVGYLLKRKGPICVIALTDAGITATSSTTASGGTAVGSGPVLSVAGVALGNVGGGVLVRYDLGSINKKLTGLGIVAGYRETAVSGVSVSPELILKLGYFLK